MSFMKSWLGLIILSIQSYAVDIYCQLPKTSIQIIELKNIYSNPSILDVKYITNFNMNGYNNQPYFVEYEKFYMTVCPENSSHPEIYQVNLSENTYNRITVTEGLGEYSPALRLETNQITCVRTEKDGKTQTLWSYPADRTSIGTRLLRSVNNVGYYNWINTDTIAIFLVKEPNELMVFDVKTGNSKLIATNPGRCLKSKDQKLFYVDKSVQNTSMLKVYDITTGSISQVINLPQGVEDFDILASGAIIIGDNSKLYTHNPNVDNAWNLLADLSYLNIKKISRIHSFRDRLAIVTSDE